MGKYSGRCSCGAVTYRGEGKPNWAIMCHCEDCQRASGADYVSWLSIPDKGLIWTGERKFHASSPDVTRSFCANCGTPMSYENEKLPGETHLYAPTLSDRSQFHPEAHIMWSERVPWIEISDGSPKYPLCRGNSEPLPEDGTRPQRD